MNAENQTVTETDVVIIGAGPVGLFQVFELGLQGIQAHLIDALPAPGGQCVELYPDKPIYDIPAIPECSGQELIDRLMAQIEPFDPVFHLDETVDALVPEADGRYRVEGSGGTTLLARAVIIAAGAGSFTPVKVRVDGIEQFENTQLFYRIRDPGQHADKHLVVLGGGDSALDWAIELAPHAKSLTLVNRTDRFRAAEASVRQLEAMAEAGKATILMGTAAGFVEENGVLKAMNCIRREDKQEVRVPLEHLLVFFGMSPKLGPLADWGMAIEKQLLTVDVSTFETSLPGVYAVGDINTYPGKKKLILSGFHETALAAFAIKERFEPDKKLHLQYTTTSPLMHKRLGVE